MYARWRESWIEEKRRGGERGRGEKDRGSVLLMLTSMQTTLCYSIAQHMLTYVVLESPVFILLTRNSIQR